MARRSVHSNDGMAQFAGDMVPASVQLAPDDKTRADAVIGENEGEVLYVHAGPTPEFAVGCRVGVILDHQGEPQPLLQQKLERNVTPFQVASFC